MNIPFQSELPTHLLAASFNKTSATYKFYWFLALLNEVEKGEQHIQKQVLFAAMLGHAWYTVNYFHVSFGKQDKLQEAIRAVKTIENLTVDADQNQILSRLMNSSDKLTIKHLWYFDAEVPHRFLSPWFNAEDKKFAYDRSQVFFNNCPYALYKEEVVINPAWQAYFQRNARVLKDFCYWNLAVYLQNRNPNVPDIPNKLIKAPLRKSLTEHRKQFWDVVIKETGGINCIYTNKRLNIGEYAVEHFVPYAFVSHNLMWNLIPADPSFNSSKSDKLPILEKHFDPFYQMQQEAVSIIKRLTPRNKFLEDYLTLFPSLDDKYFNSTKFFEQLQPIITIASNNGFEYLKA